MRSVYRHMWLFSSTRSFFSINLTDCPPPKLPSTNFIFNNIVFSLFLRTKSFHIWKGWTQASSSLYSLLLIPLLPSVALARSSSYVLTMIWTRELGTAEVAVLNILEARHASVHFPQVQCDRFHTKINPFQWSVTWADGSLNQIFIKDLCRISARDRWGRLC